MKNIIATLAGAAMLFGAAAPAFASMTFIGDGYKVPPACSSNDHAVYEMLDGTLQVSGCWTQAAVDAANARAKAAQDGIHFGRGTSITLKSGRSEPCPWYYLLSGCVIDKGLVQ